MALIGIVANKKDIQLIKKEIDPNKLEKETYKYMSEIISNVKYLIINADIDVEVLKGVEIIKPIRLITFGFNQKATITISSIKEDKIIIYIQRNIETGSRIIESQEKEIKIEKELGNETWKNLN